MAIESMHVHVLHPLIPNYIYIYIYNASFAWEINWVCQSLNIFQPNSLTKCKGSNDPEDRLLSLPIYSILFW